MYEPKIDLTYHYDKLKATFIERGKYYKDGHYRFAKVMAILLPEGPKDQGVLYYFVSMIVLKLVRFCDNLYEGGHQDSMHDLSVYGAMCDNYCCQVIDIKLDELRKDGVVELVGKHD